MTPSERGRTQTEILAAIRASAPDGRPSNREIGATIGCDPSEVGRFEKGERRMDLDEIDAAAERWGADAVLGPLAARHGRRLVPDDTVETPARDLRRAAMRVTQLGAELSMTVDEALADGVLDEAEVEAINALMTQLAAATRRACLRGVQRGRVAG